MLLKGKCEPLMRHKRAAQWSAINTKHIHPTSKEPQFNYRKIARRSEVPGLPPRGAHAAVGGGIPDGLTLGGEGNGGVEVHKGGALPEDFSSTQGWELYQAVQKAALASEGESGSRLRSGTTAQAHGTVCGSDMGGAGPGLARPRASPWTKRVAIVVPRQVGTPSRIGCRSVLRHVTRLALGLTWWGEVAVSAG